MNFYMHSHQRSSAVSYKKQRTEIVTILVAAIGEWEIGTGLGRREMVGFQKEDIALRS
jgi:hypothetical protein